MFSIKMKKFDVDYEILRNMIKQISSLIQSHIHIYAYFLWAIFHIDMKSDYHPKFKSNFNLKMLYFVNK